MVKRTDLLSPVQSSPVLICQQARKRYMHRRQRQICNIVKDKIKLNEALYDKKIYQLRNNPIELQLDIHIPGLLEREKPLPPKLLFLLPT